MNLLKLLDPNYLFDPTPGLTFSYFWPLFILFILVFVGSFYINKKLLKRPNPRVTMTLLGGIPSKMREFAVIGLVLTFLRNENIPYMGMRVWIVLLFICTLIYAIWVWRNYKKKFDTQVTVHRHVATTDKYMPKQKRKKKKKRR